MKNNNSTYKIYSLSLIIILLFTYNLFAEKDKFEFIVAKDIVMAVRKKFKSLNSYQANFNIIMESKRRKKYRSGIIYFRKPDKVRMKFSYPHNQIVISDGETVWIYLPKLRLLGEQDLTKKSGGNFFSKATPVGLDRLFSLYHYSFQKGDQPRKMESPNRKRKQKFELFYILKLKQKVITSGFREMDVWVDLNYFVRKIIAESALGKKIIMGFSNIEIDKSYDDRLFTFNKEKYKIKSIIKNPLVSP